MRYVVLAYLILGAFSVTFAVNIESTDRFGPVKANVELKFYRLQTLKCLNLC